jgi:glycosyl transferase family 2
VKLVGTMVARNERWVLGLSLRAALLAADEMIVLDHASTDGTADLVGRIAGEHPGRVHLLREDDPVWHERSIRQRLLEAGRDLGATHLLMLDADEVLTGNLLPSLRGLFASLDPGEALRLPWLALWRSLDRYRDDEDKLSHIVRHLGYRDSPSLCCSERTDGYDIHCRELKGTSGQREPLASLAEGGVFHLAFADLRRHRSKLAWYKMIETLRFSWRFTPAQLNARYDRFLNEQGLRTSPVDAAWWAPYSQWLGELDLAGDGWHGEECRRLWAEHGTASFAGLELWDVSGNGCKEEIV